ncbi:MAG: hypothetical protein J6N52_00585 [Clostridia bacterium]|nr:hypothetical protein [Clostridia bacterium]
MKGRKLLSAVIAGAMVLGTMSFPVFAASDTYTVDATHTLESVISEINTSASGDVVINLDTDANFSFGARTQIGNENTTSITIDGGNNVLDLLGTDTDWSSLGNAGGKLVFKNVTINKTEGGNGAWNNHAFNITSYVEFDNVTVNNAVTIHDGGKFTNTNFYEAGEYYTLYIPAVDQDVVIENCKFEATNAGRGIKVIEQYVSKDEKKPVDITVTGSTFKTAKKAAILVTSTEGANIVASNNNIENVNADTENLVWVDSDLPASYPKVKVTIGGEAVAPYLEEKGIGVACIGNSYYMTLTNALDAAQNGDTIDLLDNTIELDGQTKIDKDITITNGTFDITDAFCTTEGIIYIYNSSVKFSNVDLKGSNFTSAFGVIYANNNAEVTLDSCDFNLKNDMSALGGTLKGNNNASFTVKNCKFDLENPSRVLTNIKLDMSDTIIKAYVTDPTRVAGDLNNHAFRNVYGEIKNSTINVTGTETGIKNTAGGELKVSGNSAVTFSSTVNANIYLSDENEILTVEPPANVIGDIVYGTVSESVLTDKITVNFVPTADENVYDIVLDGNYKEIYEFVGAEFTFENTSETVGGSYMAYEVSGISGQTEVTKDLTIQDKYAISLAAGANRISGAEITIGQVKFIGQGTINFSVIDGTVITTKYNTNLERYYSVADNNLEYGTGITDGSVEADVRNVVVNVAYAHELDGTYWRDNQMTVTLKNAFGDIVGETAHPLTIENNAGTYTFADVPVGRITVTLKAPGFRTFTYTTTVEEGVNEDDALVLSFWNDTKRDTAQSPLKAIEAGKAPIANNFVVGDIAMDYIVDKYDLAAVTSYYGTYGLTDTNKIKYDLNRDGDIDITDVAYVLHNFGF